MGKRKRATKRPTTSRKSAKLPTVFDCPYCGHEKSVDCIIDRETSIGQVKCRICSVFHKTSICKLEEEVDVYAHWVDAIETVQAKQDAADAIAAGSTSD